LSGPPLVPPMATGVPGAWSTVVVTSDLLIARAGRVVAGQSFHYACVRAQSGARVALRPPQPGRLGNDKSNVKDINHIE